MVDALIEANGYAVLKKAPEYRSVLRPLRKETAVNVLMTVR